MISSPINCVSEMIGVTAELLTTELSQNDKLKTLDNRKMAANDKFEKIGHLPSHVMVNIKDVQDSMDKLPGLDMISANYQNELNFTDYHRPCNCTKSYCLKLYCECFARDKLCVNCNCNNCMNNISHEKSRSTAFLRILDKNPLAFLPKIGSGQGHKLHRKGCNCKRSECLKNYCECREAKIECSSLCRCQGCKNRSNDMNSHSQVPCSLDMAILDSNGFKNAAIFKSNHIIDLEKTPENNPNDLSYPYPDMYEDGGHQQNVYCSEPPMADYGSNLPYAPVNDAMDDLMKIGDNYKKIGEEFYKHPSQPLHSDSQLPQNKQPNMMHWNKFMPQNVENIEYKPIPHHPMAYNIFNYQKLPTHRRYHHPYPSSFSLDLDENCNRMQPPNNAFQYPFNNTGEYMDMTSMGYFKSYNPMPAMKRFEGAPFPYQPIQLNSAHAVHSVHSSDTCDPNDSAEVTSTNELDPNAMLVSSNSIGPDNALVKPSSDDSHSPLSLTNNGNYNCFSYAADSNFSQPSNAASNPSNYAAIKYAQNPSQAINGHVLPSLFHNDCDNTDIKQHMPYFLNPNVNQPKVMDSNSLSPSNLSRKPHQMSVEDNIAMRYASNGQYIHGNNNRFNNFPNESDSSMFMNQSGCDVDSAMMQHKSESNVDHTHYVPSSSIYLDNFPPFYYGDCNGDNYSKIMPYNLDPPH